MRSEYAPRQWAWSFSFAGDQVGAVVEVINVSSPEAGCRAVSLERHVLSEALLVARVLIEVHE